MAGAVGKVKFFLGQRENRMCGHDLAVLNDHRTVMERRIGVKNRLEKQGINLGIELDGIVDDGGQSDPAFDHDQRTAARDGHLSHGTDDLFDRFLLGLLMGM